MTSSLYSPAWFVDVCDTILAIDLALSGSRNVDTWRRDLQHARENLRELRNDISQDSRYADNESLLHGLVDATAFLTQALRTPKVSRSDLVNAVMILRTLRDERRDA